MREENNDKLSKEVFTCMRCGRQCTVEEGSWPQKYMNSDEYNMNADDNNRTREEFMCYDCID